MSRGLTISDMLDELRAAVEEENSVQIKDDYNLLPILNRAHSKAFEILTRTYPEPLLTKTDIVVNTKELVLPENVYQDKIHLAYWIDDTGRKIAQCNKSGLQAFSDADGNDNGYPSSYVIMQRKLRFSGEPAGTLRIWHMRELDRLVEPIATIDEVPDATHLSIADLDPTYSLTAGRHSSYLNIVDGQTGLIKGTIQVKQITTDEIEIRSTPDRSAVLNRDISNDLATIVDDEGAVVTISADDYLCEIRGTCVLPYWDLVHDFIIQYGIAELKRELGYAYDVDQQLVSAFRSDMTKAAVANRDAPMTIRRRNAIWNQSRWRGRL